MQIVSGHSESPRNGNRRSRAQRVSVCVAILLACLTNSTRSAGEYPLKLTVEAQATDKGSTVTSSVSIRVDRLMEENRRKRVTDTLTYSGYGNFFNALRALPPIGAIELRGRSVEIRYAHEQQEETGRRILLIADRPLFFLGGDLAKNRAGYELTLVELRFDAQGGVTGTMAGAARVKPSPSGPVLDDYAEAPVRLAARVARQ
jgi:hypothetical protein